ncbi:hypothetical protein B0H13DRAFT_2269618, partial [Mycena leptocephala]
MSYMHPPRLLHSVLPLLLLFVLIANAQDDNLLRNPTFQIKNTNSTVPDNWSLHGTTTKAMALKSMDPNTPSILFQSVPTLNSIDYQLTFDAFTSDADKGQQNLTINFGLGTWAVQPPVQWQPYTFS